MIFRKMGYDFERARNMLIMGMSHEGYISIIVQR
jgi:hypothetical protein